MINIGFTGDFCPTGRIEQDYLNNKWKDAFTGVKEFFDNNHLNVIDLECPLTTHTKPLPKTGPHLKALPQTAEMLSFLSCKLVATANNHFKDYGWEGMKQTYEALKQNGVKYIGSGANWNLASQPYLIQYDGLTIAFINAADREWSTTEDHSPGCNPLDAVAIFNTIQTAKQNADFTIIIAHGGHEHFNLPSPRIKQLYRFFIDAGASAVIGHHTHIIGAFEVYKDAPIFYSLGNFFFDWKGMRNHHWNFGMIVKLTFVKNKPIQFETYYIEQNNEYPEVKFVHPEKEKELIAKQLSINEILQDDQKLKQNFESYTHSLKPLMNTWIEPYRGSLLPSLHKKGFIPTLMSKKKKQLLTILIQCETHRDVLLYAIDQRKKQ